MVRFAVRLDAVVFAEIVNVNVPGPVRVVAGTEIQDGGVTGNQVQPVPVVTVTSVVLAAAPTEIDPGVTV